MAYSQSWLDSQASIRGIFVEATVYDVVAAEDIQLYISSVGFITEDGVTSFEPVINPNSINITESMSLDGGLSFSFGDIEIRNENGERDDWLESTKYIWVNRPVVVYLGDPLWTIADLAQLKTDFKIVFNGLIADIDSKSRETLNLKIRDKLERLNTPLTETKLGSYGTWAGGQTNTDSIKPIIFGEVHNIEPLLIDPANLEYMFGTGESERVIELRDNGVPIYSSTTLTSGATIDLANSKFTLAHPLVGQLTASIQGVKRTIDLDTGTEVSSYTNNIAELIALITMKYGKQGVSNLTADDIDLDNFDIYSAIESAPVGIPIFDRDNVLDVCQQLASSIGAQLYFNRLGKLTLLRLGTALSGDGPNTVTESDILFNSLEISGRTTVQASTTIAYCKNWTVQEGLLTGIPEAHKDLFAMEWLTRTDTDTAVKALYRLNAATPQQETLLLVGSDALNEAERRTNYFKEPHTTYKFVGNSRLLSLELGEDFTLIHHRFNLYDGGDGVTAQVISLSPDWVNATVTVEVIV